jgi:cation transport ATPase
VANEESFWSKQTLIAAIAIAGIAIHLILRYTFAGLGSIGHVSWQDIPLIATLIFGGIPLVLELLGKLFRGQFGSDLLAGISIVTSVILGEYLAGSLVVLMLSGGEALEAYAVRKASSVLEALAKRLPSSAHRKRDGILQEVKLEEVVVGDLLVVLPHEICPVDGTIVEGHGVMDESYLTGEPYMMSKSPGSSALSGAINGETALTLRADKAAIDSRYAKIMEVMRASEQRRPRLRRLGDQLGAWYTPVAVLIALAAWIFSWSWRLRARC